MSPYFEYESPVSYGRTVMCKVFSDVGQRSRSWSCDQNVKSHRKSLVIKNTPAQYEIPMYNGKKVKCRVKVFQMKVKGHGEGHLIKIYGWCHRKGLVIRNTHAKYENPIS